VAKKGGFYALKIKIGVLRAQIYDVLRRLRDGDTKSKVTSEVEEVVLSLTRTNLGGTAPKNRVGVERRGSTKVEPTLKIARV
jgi:hypothetical protein